MLNKFGEVVSQEESNKVDTIRYAFLKLLDKAVNVNNTVQYFYQ